MYPTKNNSFYILLFIPEYSYGFNASPVPRNNSFLNVKTLSLIKYNSFLDCAVCLAPSDSA